VFNDFYHGDKCMLLNYKRYFLFVSKINTPHFYNCLMRQKYIILLITFASQQITNIKLLDEKYTA